MVALVSYSKDSPLLLCILDGFGLNPEKRGNAIAQARTPVFDRLFIQNPSATLITHGLSVGLPKGQMGNSEVGHLTIGAGRVVKQWLLKISDELKDGTVEGSETFTNFCRATSGSSAVHLIGLFSDGGVHSHEKHLFSFIELLEKHNPASRLVLHLITDGRDVSPHQAAAKLKELNRYLTAYPRVVIGTVMGRLYAMDRDTRWKRTEKAYRAIALADAPRAESALAWVESSYKRDITDEFIEPAVINPSPIGAGDGIVFWNFRADRMRQIVRVLSLADFNEFKREHPLPARENVLCFTEYDSTFGLPYLFAPEKVLNHMGEVISNLGLKQLRTAETEKYPHVTYFFNSGVEEPYPGENRKLIPSPRDVKTYDLKPEMSAYPVKDVVVNALNSGEYDFIVVNFANCDMVGHTGVIEAAIKAAETVDHCLGEVVEALKSAGGCGLVIADHGNAEQMINYDDGSPHTAHTTWPVPVIALGMEGIKLRDGTLADVAPTLLKMAEISRPKEMTGEALF
ncbi:MAG: 2,3-bisphosphoglycerate-independent phosphoglycerate mutase [Candidatus Dadabacteria bacterium]|nr:MAG: 2,3-bisphosphoglycerate-independent phosphoglycerate mutase [Candidatus Dadabacteria bacterium]